jgi:hypothetical protein
VLIGGWRDIFAQTGSIRLAVHRHLLVIETSTLRVQCCHKMRRH